MVLCPLQNIGVLEGAHPIAAELRKPMFCRGQKTTVPVVLTSAFWKALTRLLQS